MTWRDRLRTAGFYLSFAARMALAACYYLAMTVLPIAIAIAILLALS